MSIKNYKKSNNREIIKNKEKMKKQKESIINSAIGYENSDYIGTIKKEIDKGNSLHNETMNQHAKNHAKNGYTMETHHTTTYSIDSAVKKGNNRAEMPKSNTKNSPDVVIKNKTGKIEQEVQVKNYKTGRRTDTAFEKGDYRGQKRVGPGDQKGNFDKKIQTSDGTSSKELGYEESKELSNTKDPYNFDNTVQRKSYLKSTIKQMVIAALLGGGITLVQGIINKDDAEQIAQDVMKSGIKAAAITGVVRELSYATKGAVRGIPAVAIAVAAVETVCVLCDDSNDESKK